VDAAHGGGRPGEVRRYEAGARPLPSAAGRQTSTHGLGVPEAIELARVLHRLPPRVVVYAIDGADFGAGTGLSPAVEDAAGSVVACILRELSMPPAAGGIDTTEEGPHTHA